MNDAVSLPSVARLRWQCRRGMLELDLALSAYLENCYAELDDAGKRAFIDFLALDDPTLNAWLLGNAAPIDLETANLVVAVRAAAQAAA